MNGPFRREAGEIEGLSNGVFNNNLAY